MRCVVTKRLLRGEGLFILYGRESSFSNMHRYSGSYLTGGGSDTSHMDVEHLL